MHTYIHTEFRLAYSPHTEIETYLPVARENGRAGVFLSAELHHHGAGSKDHLFHGREEAVFYLLSFARALD